MSTPTPQTPAEVHQAWTERLKQCAERNRRESPSVSTTPIKFEVPDYAHSGQLIELGMHHLNEALPIGQLVRAEAAYQLLVQGVAELGTWMRARGYMV